MKQLTKEQQEQAVEIIEKFILVKESPSKYDPTYFINSAKAFLKSLKPKVYVCKIRSNEIYYLKEDCVGWCNYTNIAKGFSSIEEAREVLQILKKNKNCKYFIITE